MTRPLTPGEVLGEAAALFLDRMPDGITEECRSLVAMDPTALGVRVHYIEDTDVYDLTWVGRFLGSVPGDGARGGVSPRLDDIGS